MDVLGKVRSVVAIVLGLGLLAITVDMWLRAHDAMRFNTYDGEALEMVFWFLTAIAVGIIIAFILAAVGYYYAKSLGYGNPGEWALAAVFGGEMSLWFLMITGGWKKFARKEVWCDMDAEDVGRTWLNAHFILFCIFAPIAIAAYVFIFWFEGLSVPPAP